MLAGNASAKCRLSGAGLRAATAHRGCPAVATDALRWLTSKKSIRRERSGSGSGSGLGSVRCYSGIGSSGSRDRYLVVPSSPPLRVYGWRASSTHTGAAAKDDDETVAAAEVTADTESCDDVLASVSRRAKQIAEVGTMPASPLESIVIGSSTPDASSARAAISAAEGLLELTSSSSLAGALAKAENPRGAPPEVSTEGSVVNNLHSALLSITSRICSHGEVERDGAPSEEEDDDEEGEWLVSVAMDLVRRSSELGLPLHQSLFADVAALAASRSGRAAAGGQNSAATRILDVASAARSSLHPNEPVPPSFFSRALVALVGRGMLRDAIELLECMYTPEYGMVVPELDAGMDMLGTLADKLLVNGELAMSSIKRRHAEARRGVEECVRDGDVDRAAEIKQTALMPLREVLEQHCDSRSADAMELALILRGPVLRQLNAATTDRLGDILSIMSRIRTPLDEGSDDDYDSDSDMEAEEAEADLISLCEAVDALCSTNGDIDGDPTTSEVSPVSTEGGPDDEVWGTISPEAEATIKRLCSADREQGVPPIVDVEVDGQTQQGSEMYHGIYTRPSGPGEIPDLIDDMKRWNSGGDIRYTREYEKHILDEWIKDDASDR